MLGPFKIQKRIVYVFYLFLQWCRCAMDMLVASMYIGTLAFSITNKTNTANVCKSSVILVFIQTWMSQGFETSVKHRFFHYAAYAKHARISWSQVQVLTITPGPFLVLPCSMAHHTAGIVPLQTSSHTLLGFLLCHLCHIECLDVQMFNCEEEKKWVLSYYGMYMHRIQDLCLASWTVEVDVWRMS